VGVVDGVVEVEGDVVVEGVFEVEGVGVLQKQLPLES